MQLFKSLGSIGERLMAVSDSGRKYAVRDLPDEDGKSERFWTCSECGALVGPYTTNRDLHDRWHDRISDSR